MPEGTSGQDVTPVLAAISQRRVELLRQLARPQQYSRIYVHSAIRSNDAAIVLAVLGAPHETIEPLSISALTSAPISLEVAEALIALKGQQAANAVLYEGAQKGRLELVQLGLARGADANAADSSGKTPLFVALDSYQFDPLPIVDALLKAGADVNQPPRRGTGFENAFWRAYRRATSTAGPRPELLRRVERAGGDANVPLRPGIPPVWTVVFPPRGDLTEIIAPSEPILRILIDAGLDINAVHQKQCVLDAVEKLTGPTGEAATTLRKLGARRMLDGDCRA